MMQIVIDISKHIYEHAKEQSEDSNDEWDAMRAIANGTPLPKGHGKLKDIDKIISDGMSKGFCDWYDEMQYADTIIEADTPKRRKGTPLEENDSGYNCENWIP